MLLSVLNLIVLVSDHCLCVYFSECGFIAHFAFRRITWSWVLQDKYSCLLGVIILLCSWSVILLFHQRKYHISYRLSHNRVIKPICKLTIPSETMLVQMHMQNFNERVGRKTLRNWLTKKVFQRKTYPFPSLLFCLSAFPPICFIVQICPLLIYSFKFIYVNMSI